VVASAGDDATVRVWDPRDADSPIAVHTGHTGRVNAVWAFEFDGRTLIASAGNDRTVRLWKPLAADTLASVFVHYAVQGVTSYEKSVVACLETGLVAIALSDSLLT
jgi:WD40 repeat protein